jgi:hypothetical protein
MTRIAPVGYATASGREKQLLDAVIDFPVVEPHEHALAA